MGCKESDMTEQLTLTFNQLSCALLQYVVFCCILLTSLLSVPRIQRQALFHSLPHHQHLDVSKGDGLIRWDLGLTVVRTEWLSALTLQAALLCQAVSSWNCRYWGLARAFQVALVVKNPPAMQDMWVQSLGREDPLEEEMATHSTNLVWEIRWTEELESYSPWGCRVGHNWITE